MPLNRRGRLLPPAPALELLLKENDNVAQAHAQDWSNRRGDLPPAIAGRDTVMRAGPLAGYPQIRRLPQGEPVRLHGCLPDRSWCDVGHGNDRGWIGVPDRR